MRLHRGRCTDTVRESALEVDSGRRIPCCTGAVKPALAACQSDATNCATSLHNIHTHNTINGAYLLAQFKRSEEKYMGYVEKGRPLCIILHKTLPYTSVWNHHSLLWQNSLYYPTRSSIATDLHQKFSPGKATLFAGKHKSWSIPRGPVAFENEGIFLVLVVAVKQTKHHPIFTSAGELHSNVNRCVQMNVLHTDLS